MRALTHSLRGRSWLLVLALFAVSCSTPSTTSPVANKSTATPSPSPSPPTQAELEKAQRDWCDGLVKISELSREPNGDWQGEANRFVDKMYEFNGDYKLLFRPTLAYKPHAFRTDRPGTLSYFIGGNDAYPDGEGFARGPWKACDYSNDLPGGVKGIQIYGNIALVMGTVTLTDLHNEPTTVDKIFVFRKLGEGNLKLITHMSAKANETPTPTPTPCPK